MPIGIWRAGGTEWEFNQIAENAIDWTLRLESHFENDTLTGEITVIAGSYRGSELALDTTITRVDFYLSDLVANPDVHVLIGTSTGPGTYSCVYDTTAIADGSDWEIWAVAYHPGDVTLFTETIDVVVDNTVDPPPPDPPARTRVLVIGDGVIETVENELTAALVAPEYTVTRVEGVGGSGVSISNNNTPVGGWPERLRQLIIEDTPNVIVIHLGLNDRATGITDYGPFVDQMVYQTHAVAEFAFVRRVVWINCHNKGTNTTHNATGVEINADILAKRNTYSKLEVIDFSALTTTNPTWINTTTDPQHLQLTAAGQTGLSNAVLFTLASTPQPPPDPEPDPDPTPVGSIPNTDATSIRRRKVLEAVSVTGDEDNPINNRLIGRTITKKKKYVGQEGTWAGQWVPDFRRYLGNRGPNEGKEFTLGLPGMMKHTRQVTGVSGTSNPTITVNGDHGLSTGDKAWIKGLRCQGNVLAFGSTQERNLVATRINSTQFQLNGVTLPSAWNGVQRDYNASHNFADCNAGQFDTYWHQARDILLNRANALNTIKAGDGAKYLQKIILSPMWEHNGNWYMWSTRYNKGLSEDANARTGFINYWRRLWKIIMFGLVNESGAPRSSAATGSIAQKYPGTLRWRMAPSRINLDVRGVKDCWPGDEYVDVATMNWYGEKGQNSHSAAAEAVNFWNGVGLGRTGDGGGLGPIQELVRVGAITDPGSNIGNGVKHAMDWLAYFCRTPSYRGAGSSGKKMSGTGEYSTIAVRAGGNHAYSYLADTIPNQGAQGLYDWAIANSDIVQQLVQFEFDYDFGWQATWRVRAERTDDSYDGVQKFYRSYDTPSGARSAVNNTRSHFPGRSNKWMDLFGGVL